MAETQFIRTVVFGGYDKGDVDKRLDYVYEMFFENKNKLREAKLLLDKMKGGADEQDALDSVLGDERAKLTELQVKNQNLVEKNRTLGEELAAKDRELEELKSKLAETEAQLMEAQAKLASEGGANSGAMLNVVFQQAQTSANLILSTAQKQAADLESDSKKLAENTITDANNKAKEIIYEAETKASEITAAASEKSSAMDVASGNIKAAVLQDVEKMSIELAKFRSVFERFRDSGSEMLSQSQEFLDDAVVSLTTGGVPVFRQPEPFEPDLVESPSFEEIDDFYITGSEAFEDMMPEKKNDTLEKLKQKAASIGGSGGDDNDNEEPASGGSKKVSLAELAEKAKTMKK